MDSLDLLTDAAERGPRSSEFWLTVVAAVVLVALPLSTGRALALAVVVAAYGVGRAYVKAATTAALLQDVEPPVRIGEEHPVRPMRS